MCIIHNYNNGLVTIAEVIIVDGICGSITSIPSELVNITVLICDNSHITEIPTTLVNLTTLCMAYCIYIDIIPVELVNLTFLNCSNSIISDIPSEFINLTTLHCSYTNITSLPIELVNLIELKCNHTEIETLPSEYINLDKLYCYNTLLSTIPSTYIHLHIIKYNNNNLIFPPELCIVRKGYHNIPLTDYSKMDTVYYILKGLRRILQIESDAIDTNNEIDNIKTRLDALEAFHT